MGSADHNESNATEVTPEKVGVSIDSAALFSVTPAASTVASDSGVSQSFPTCGSGEGLIDAPLLSPRYVYVIGRIEPRFPSLSVEKEFAQVTGRSDTGGLTDRQVLHAIMSKQENRYLVRQLCWVMTVQGFEAYILVPRDTMDFNLLIQSLRLTSSPSDLDVVIGVRGPLAPPSMCNGLMIPIIAFDQIYSFSRESLVESIPRPEKTRVADFKATAEELFDRIMQMTDNAGSTDAHRALNYLAVRYPAIYYSAAEAFGRNQSLTSVDVRPSTLSVARAIVDVIFTYTSRATGVEEKLFVRLDVNDEFPFLITKLSPYYDRLS